MKSVLFFLFFLALNDHADATSQIIIDQNDAKSISAPASTPSQINIPEDVKKETDRYLTVNLRESSRDPKDKVQIHLYDLTNDVLQQILSYASHPESFITSKLFYHFVTAEQIGKTPMGFKGSFVPQGIRGNQDIHYNVLHSVLCIQDSTRSVPRTPINISMEKLPTWFCRNWITNVEYLPYDLISQVPGSNVRSLNFNFYNSDHNLQDQPMGEQASIILDPLKTSNVEQLFLNNHNIGADAENFGKVISKTNIRWLDVTGNNMGSHAPAFIKALQGSDVKTLHMSSNNIDSSDALDIAESSKNIPVKYIILSNNPIDQETKDKIFQLDFQDYSRFTF